MHSKPKGLAGWLKRLKGKVYNNLSYIITYYVIISTKEFEDYLSPCDFIRVIIRKRGKMPKEVVIVCFTVVGGKEIQFVRVDCSHGIMHWDRLSETKKSRRKEIIHSELSGSLIKDILGEIRENWREMKEKFFRGEVRRHLGEKKG